MTFQFNYYLERFVEIGMHTFGKREFWYLIIKGNDSPNEIEKKNVKGTSVKSEPNPQKI